MNFTEYKKNKLQNEEFKKAYEELEPEYEIIRRFVKKIEKEENNSLAYKLRKAVTEYVSDEEQKDIEKTLSKLSKEDLEIENIIKL